MRLVLWLGLLAWLVSGAVWIVAAGHGADFILGTGRQPEIGTDVVGNSVVVWDAEGAIQGQGIDPMGNSTGDFTIASSTLSPANPANPDVAYMPGGDFVVAWEWQNGSNSQIAAQTFSANGRPAGVEYGLTPEGIQPVVGADDQGRLVLVWSVSLNAGGYRYMAQRFSANGRPAGVEFRVGSGVGPKPALSVKSNGDFMIAWESLSHQIQGQVFDSTGVAYEPAFRVNRTPSGQHQLPDVAVGLDDDFTVVWEGSPGASGKRRVLARRVLGNGRPAGVEFRVSGKLSGDEDSWPSVAADQQGHIVVTWRQQLADGMDAIGVRELSANGRPAGVELRLQASDRATRPEISPAGDMGDFLVVWQGETEEVENGESQIFGRYLQLPLEDDE